MAYIINGITTGKQSSNFDAIICFGLYIKKLVRFMDKPVVDGKVKTALVHGT